MRYSHFKPFRVYILAKPLNFAELEKAFNHAGNILEYPVEVERGERSRDRNPRTGRFEYSQPSAQFRFVGKPIAARGIPVREKDMRDFTLHLTNPSWAEFYSGIRFYAPPKDQRSKDHRKHTDYFAHYVSCIINRWIENPRSRF